MRNNKGFTLAELIVAGGIAGMIGLVAVTSLRNTRQASNILVVASESTTLKSLIVAQLANPEACKKTFADKLIERPDLEILAASGAVIAKKGQVFGPTKEFSITEISSTSAAGSNTLKIKVAYVLKASLDKASKKKSYDFDIDIFVNKAGTKITGCYIDITGAIKKAIKLSCEGVGVVYDETDGLYGSCTHSLPEIQNKDGVVVPTGLCPKGQYLKRVTLNENPALPLNNKVILQCKPFAIGPCGDYAYVNKIGGTENAADCVSMSTLFGQGKVLSTVKNGANTDYISVDLNCTTDDKVVRKIDKTTGLVQCIPKHIKTDCPAGYYVHDVDVTDKDDIKINCKKFSVLAACPANTYLQSALSDGSPGPAPGGCVPQVLPNAHCPVGQVIWGIDSNGYAICRVI
jgi:Tfp pilus assembly major pilin PilA